MKNWETYQDLVRFFISISTKLHALNTFDLALKTITAELPPDGKIAASACAKLTPKLLGQIQSVSKYGLLRGLSNAMNSLPHLQKRSLKHCLFFQSWSADSRIISRPQTFLFHHSKFWPLSFLIHALLSGSVPLLHFLNSFLSLTHLCSLIC